MKMALSEEGEWHECVCDNDYEINDSFPYPIRRKGSDKIINECFSKGYYVCSLNHKLYKKHRIIALQFIPNNNPEEKTYIDHIDRNKTNNHISNLRWVNSSENQKNKSSNLSVVYDFVDSIDDDAIEITDYNDNHFESYYYVESEDSFYFYNGVNYRKLHINTSKRGFKSIYAINTENKQVQISLNKFKMLYGIQI